MLLNSHWRLNNQPPFQCKKQVINKPNNIIIIYLLLAILFFLLPAYLCKH